MGATATTTTQLQPQSMPGRHATSVFQVHGSWAAERGQNAATDGLKPIE